MTGVAHRATVRALPVVLGRRFDAASATGLSAVFELRVRDRRRGDVERFELRVADGSFAVRPGAAQSPSASVELSSGDLVRLAGGTVAWPQLLSAGRLKLEGDPFVALRFPLLFRLPAVRG